MKKDKFDDELTMLWCQHISEKQMEHLEDALVHIADAPVPISLKYALMQHLHNAKAKQSSSTRFVFAAAFSALLAMFFVIFHFQQVNSPTSPENFASIQDSNDEDVQLAFDDDLFFDDPLLNLEDNV